MERRPELRRSMTLSEQLATPDPAIREFLRIPDDDSHRSDDADDAGRGWKPLRDRLRLRRAANAWTAPSSQRPGALKGGGGAGSGSTRSNKYIYAPGEATAAFSRTTSLRQTPNFSRVASTRGGPTSASTIGRADRVIVHDGGDEEDEEEEEEEEEEDEDGEGGKEDEAPSAQMSLMALLEQTDSWDEEDEEDEAGGGGGGGGGGDGGGGKNAQQQATGGGGDDDEDDGEGREEEMVHVCCVCMVRHKGAAFIPCGHTFCRLCSRELWVSRGNCPLCNGFIQEILDIF